MTPTQQIPQWRIDEVSQYDTGLDFTPKSILDIGANIGVFSMRCHAQWPQARIIAFEPVPENGRRYQENCPWAEFRLDAVRSFTGKDTLLLGDLDVTGSFHNTGRQPGGKIEVDCFNAASIESCELVKIDTEGCEVEILERLHLTNTRVLVCEYHRPGDDEKIRTIAAIAGLVEISHIPNPAAPGFGLLKFARPELLPKTQPHLRSPISDLPSPIIPDDTRLTGNTADGRLISIEARHLRHEHYRPELAGMKLFIALPVYSQTATCFVRCLMELQAHKPLPMVVHIGQGDGVGRTRNVLTAEFLKSDCTHLLFIDSDLIFSAQHIIDLLVANKPVVGGFYPKKQQGPLEWVINTLPNTPGPIGSLQPLKYIGTGFLCIQRHVFEAMIARYPELRFREDYGNRNIAHDFWSMGVYRPAPEDEGRYLSEDWYFCQRWLDMGGEIFGHINVILKHLGNVIFPLTTQLPEIAAPIVPAETEQSGSDHAQPAAAAGRPEMTAEKLVQTPQ